MIPKLFFWNVRGLNDPNKHRPMNFWLQAHQPLFGALLETHIKEMNLNQVMISTCPGWNFTSNHQSDEDGRIVIIWKNSITATVLHQSRQSLTVELQIYGGTSIIYTAVYASNLEDERTQLWLDLQGLK